MKRALLVLAAFIMITSPAFTARSAMVDVNTFILKDGSVHKGKTTIDRQVNEVPPEIGGPIRYWSAFGPDTSDAVKENETGIWFFPARGASLRHIPLDSENECQGVFFSPDGGALVVQTGGPIGADVTFDVYGDGPEKIAELSGVRGALAWLDPVRFVMTRIDDARTGPNYENRGGQAFGLRTSIVMFDAATKETSVLKESTARQNFWFDDVIENGNAISGREEYVKSEDDWGDEKKEQTRDIRIEVPAAG